ncbi:hypothetical protein F5B22DRAFT_110747 [Xylaria bambusicola]|uniref:uncharacterized protein n=1 Tax=Xylaria bambusicola TaxID=326684 RepID=UPI0020080A3F|nr:uncharacterized protein F5B22DRAFT_110747 [Xylaria bambusicola]KAI0517593.1 hypothetical protein F5B22DRAFT_110747 [Xylaria bambusicola]
MECISSPRLQQIRVGIDHHPSASAANGFDAKEAHAKEHATYQDNLLSKCPAHLWSKASYRAASPRPILVTEHHQQRVEALSEALTTALTSIVKRWWSDEEARFFERMPLTRDEEELLRWLDDQVSQGKLKDYSACRGSWRPDFLIEERAGSRDGVAIENFMITEINARFSFNGAFYVSYGQDVLDEMPLGQLNLSSTTTSATMLNGLRTLFNPTVPLHLLIEEEAGIDIHMFVHAAQDKFGLTPRMIRPSDLRLEPSPDTHSGYKLCCLTKGDGAGEMIPPPPTFVNDKGETVEEILQVGLELRQHELFGLPREILRHISLCCFNDLRTLLLVHDKRMLGIVKQELGRLVKQQVLTPAQARVLDEGIVDTYLPNSPQLSSLLQKSISEPSLKDDYILKPVRGGKGAGIIFGDDLTAEEWLSKLTGLLSQAPFLGTTYVIQRRVNHCLYDLVMPASVEKVRYPLVGTFHIFHGRFCGLGIWRSSAERICAISSGGSMLCSVSRSL